MAYASKAGRARTSATNPQAHAICDRCGFRYNRTDLRWQYDWAGATMVNKRVLVCDRCYDTPQEQLRAIILPADPVPILDARVEYFVADETSVPVGATVIGYPNGIDPNAQMPLVMAQRWAQPVSLISVLSNGSTTITVNTNGAHGLSTNAQISVEGLNNAQACGAFSITVVNATQFTYTALYAIPTASLAGPTTRMITLNVGLPYGQTTIPPVGPT